MASSALPLSLLAKGIGQIVTNGHEKLEVYLEPEDYYNLKSYSPYHFDTLHENARSLDIGDAVIKPIPLHKTFVTRKGALLLFSEELANKAFAEEVQKLKLKDEARSFHKPGEDLDGSKPAESEKVDDPLRTVHDLKVAILMYGNRPDYRRKGDDLYLRFINEAKAPKDERRIRPGFSPKRYITAWSRHWHEEMLQKMRSTGLVQDKTLYRQNPLLPHLYQPASYNLSSVPPPYRVTKNMLRAGDIGTYEYQRVPRAQPRVESGYEPRDRDFRKNEMRRGPPPSTDSKGMKGEQQGPIPVGSIQAVRFLESGEVQEVKYSELKSQEKQEILAELLATAWEHGKHIEEMLDLVLASNKPRTNSAASSSAASELMMDMHRAILSLAESPVQKQIREKQQEAMLEKQRKKQEHEEAKRERKRQRMKKRADREAQIAKETSKRHEEEEQLRLAKKNAENEERKRKIDKQQKQAHLKGEAELQDQQRQIELEEKEKNRQARRDARKKKEEERAARKKEKHELAQKQEEVARQQQEEEERLHLEEKRQREEKREERRRLREERKRQKLQEQQQQQARTVSSRPAELQEMTLKSHNGQAASLLRQPHDVSHAPGQIGTVKMHEIPGTEWEDGQSSQGSRGGDIIASTPTNQGHVIPKSRPLPSVPHNTPATQQRTTRVIQRQLPLENVIYEAKSKRSQASSSTTSSSKSRRGVPAQRPPGTVVSSGDGEFATYVPPVPTAATQQRQLKHAKKKKMSPVQRIQAAALEPAMSHSSSHSSKKNSVIFPAELPGDAKSSGKSSFYGGAMPITSNIVKQTLSDKISILSASQDYSASGSARGQSMSERSGQPQQDNHSIPLIGVEPPTPILGDTAMGKDATQIPFVPSPVPSASTRSGNLKQILEKGSSTEFSNESDDEPYLSDTSNLSVTKSQKNEEGAVIFTKKPSTTLTGDSTTEAKYQVLKGFKGPGSQSSAATLSLKTGSKKSSSITRGSIPHALLKHKQAAIFMPDQKIVDVSTKGDISSTTEQATLTEESTSGQLESQKLPLKSSLKDASKSSSIKSERRVSFQEGEEETATSSEEEDVEEDEDDSEVDESEKEETEWPQVAQDLRPISSRSAKLTEHAQKVAQAVVSAHRPDSKLEEDATEAVKLWNKMASKPEDASSSEEESEETSEADEEESSVGWNANQSKEEEIVQKEDQEEKDVKKVEKLAKKKPDKLAVKEIVARKPATTTAPSVKSYKSTSSGRTSVSSIQEAFVKEVKRKASELGISEKELEFEPEIVSQVVNSTVDPGELEVFHDAESGKHVVRSRHSSFTTKSYGTDNTASTAGDESKAKQKYVIDMPKEVTGRSASPQPSVSATTSTTASPTSPSRIRALSQSSRKSSGGDQEVTLGYELTSYEGKLGDPKPEEPAVVMRKKVEPERLDKTKSDRRESKAGQKAEKDAARKGKEKEKQSKPQEDLSDTKERESDYTTSSVRSGASLGKGGKTSDGKAQQKKGGRKGKEKGKGAGATTRKQPEGTVPTAAVASPSKPLPKTPEVPFVAGRAKDEKGPKGLQSPTSSVTPKTKKGKTKGAEAKQDPKTQVEMEDKSRKGKLSDSSLASKDLEKTTKTETKDSEKPRPKSKTPVQETPKSSSPAKADPLRTQSETPDGDLDQLSPIPAESPEDDYDFVRVEESPPPSEPEPVVEETAIDQMQDDAKSMASDQTAPTEATEKTDDTEERMRAAEEEEARLAKKKDKDDRRLAAAEKRRLDVERKRKEKEDQLKKEREEQERQDALKEELENERRRRTEEMQKKRDEVERERQREEQEAELRKRREQQQQERDRRMQEEHKKKMEELQKKKREEEARKAEFARIKAEEEEQARKEEEELMAQMAEDERIEYEKRKREEAEAKRLLEEERRRIEEEEARIAMEQARLQALIRAKQQAALEEKLKFARELFVEANGMDQTQNVNRAFCFSYFELLELLGLDFADVNFEI